MNDWWFKLKRTLAFLQSRWGLMSLTLSMGMGVQPLWHHLREASSPSPRPVLQAKRLVMKVYWGGRDFEGWQNEFGTWLQRDTGAGVLFCQKCNVTWDEGTVQKANLTKHSKSFKHLKNTNGVSKSSKSEAAALLKLAPPTSEFYECLTHRLKGSSFRGSDGGPKREATMTWCISEVLKDRERKKIDQACCIGFSQDVQGSTLSVRSSCCFGSDLQLSRSLLGYMKCETGAEGVASATKKVIQHFFTKRRKPPEGWVGRKDVFLRGPMNRYCSKVVTWLNVFNN